VFKIIQNFFLKKNGLPENRTAMNNPDTHSIWRVARNFQKIGRKSLPALPLSSLPVPVEAGIFSRMGMREGPAFRKDNKPRGSGRLR